MKKKLLATILCGLMIFSLAACGKSKDAAPAADADAQTQEAEAADAESEAPEAESETQEADPLEDAATDPDQAAAEAETGNAEADALANADYASFAKKIQDAFAAKDINALADLVTYPTYVSLDDGITVETKEDFVALGDKIFTDEMVKAIAEVDTATLEPSQAGIFMGSENGKPGVTFGSDTEGNMGITGINY